MGEDLSLDGREAIRTPMQWDDTPNAGFSRSAARRSFSTRCHEGSVRRKEGQRARAATRPEFAAALVREPDTHPAYRAGDRHRYLLGHRRPAAALGAGTPIRRARPGRSCCCTIWPTTTVTVDIGAQPGMNGDPYDLFVDGPYAAPTEKLTDLTLNGWGYRWIRLSRSDRG